MTIRREALEARIDVPLIARSSRSSAFGIFCVSLKHMNLQPPRTWPLILIICLLFIGVTVVQAATTISANIQTDGTLSVAGAITSTATTANTFPYASSTALTVSGTSYFSTASTTNLTVSGISGCSGSSALTTNALGALACGVISALAWPWTPTTNYGATANATSTPIWFQDGLQASSTARFVYASTTALTVSGTTYLNGDITAVGRLMLPMGEVNYFNMTPTTVVIASQSDGNTNMVVVPPVTVLNSNSYEFDNGGGNTGRLRYTGATTKMFHIAFSISMDADGAGTNVYVFGIAKNGSVGSCKTLQSIAAGSSAIGSTSLHCFLSLATNDYLELYVGNTTDGDDISVNSLNIFAMGM